MLNNSIKSENWTWGNITVSPSNDPSYVIQNNASSDIHGSWFYKLLSEAIVENIYMQLVFMEHTSTFSVFSVIQRHFYDLSCILFLIFVDSYMI